MKTKRVLVWGLSNNRAGTESVIFSYVSRIHDVSFDFLCYDEPLNYAELFDGTDNHYFVIPIKIKHPIENRRALHEFMRDRAHLYTALWFNVNEISNIDLLRLAKRYGIQRRITHMHNPCFPNDVLPQLFSRLNWKKCLQLTTDRWACSSSAGSFLFKNLPFKVIPNAVDAGSCAFDLEKREIIRHQWGIEDKFVVGTVGRLADQKNPRFLIDILPDLLAFRPDVILMFVGQGNLAGSLRSIVEKRGLGDKVVFAGSQRDVGAYLSAFDVFAFPSHFEGLGLSVIEAQFNGLPCVVSEGVPEEAIISSTAARIALSDKKAWCKALGLSERVEGSLMEDKAAVFRFDFIENLANELF